MGSDDSLKTWVSDKLMSLLGYSQPTVIQYIIGLCNSFHTIFLTVNFFYIVSNIHFGKYILSLGHIFGNMLVFAAKQATSPADVVNKLVEFGCSSTGETRAFAEEMFARVPRKATGLNVSFFWRQREHIPYCIQIAIIICFRVNYMNLL